MKRVYSVDLLKSVMIMLVIVGHRIFYDWSGYQNPGEGKVPPLLLVFGFFAAMGSIFAYITGLVTSFSVSNRMSKGRNTPAQLILASLVTFSSLATINYVILYFLAGGVYVNDGYHYGVLISLIKFGEMQSPGLEVLFLYAGILMSIGISGFAVTVVSALLYRRERSGGHRWDRATLFGLGLVILGLSAFLPFILEPIMLEAFDTKNYLVAFVLANMVAFDFPIFPLLGFAFIGATLGLSLASGDERRAITNRWTIFSAGIITVGILLAVIFLLRGQLILNFARYVHLGIFVIVILVLLHQVDFEPQDKKKRIVKRFDPVLRFGRITLTIFVLETPLAAVLHLIPDTLFPGWDSNVGLVLLFALINLVLWWVGLEYWRRSDYRGSIEWVIAKITKLMSGKSSDKIHI